MAFEQARVAVHASVVKHNASGGVLLEIRDVFDLHSIAPKEVKRVVEEYLHEARRAGFRSVRIIHGKGKGVQREMVRTILARTPFVEDWTDAPPEAGGLGATIVYLSLED